MEFEFERRFFRDLENYSNDLEFLRLLWGKTKEIENAGSFDDIAGMDDIRGRKVHYRFKVSVGKTTYRIGLKVLHGKIWFTVIDKHKKRFYERI